jgi:hypothetical protein
MPEEYIEGFRKSVRPEVSDRLFYLPQDGLGIRDWAERVYIFVEGLEHEVVYQANKQLG